MNLGNPSAPIAQNLVDEPVSQEAAKTIESHLDYFAQETEIKKDPIQQQAASITAPVPGEMTEQQRKESAKTSAITLVSLTDALQRPILIPVTNWKYKRKLEKNGLDKAEEYLDKKAEERTAEENHTISKAEKMMLRWQKETEAIPYSEKEKNEMVDLLQNYYYATGKTLSPNFILFATFFSSISKRITTAIFE